MWVLYRITSSSGSTLKPFSRLRPDQNYAIKIKGSKDEQGKVLFGVSSISSQDVINARSRPDLILHRYNHSVVVDGKLRDEEQIHLHDQQILQIGKCLSSFKVVWEPVIIYHDKHSDRRYHEKLINQGQEIGFHVIDAVDGQFNRPTHFCASDYTKNDEPSNYLYLSLALNSIYFIRDQWVNELCDTADAQFELKAFNDRIQAIEVHDFNFIGQIAVFGPDERRKKLFNKMEFWFFNQQQLKDSEKLIKLVGGKCALKTFQQVMDSPVPTESLFITPPDADNLPGWYQVLDKFCDAMEVNRTVQSQEIKYAILFASTNQMCNPAAPIDNFLHQDSALYASFQSGSYRASSSVKLEALDATLPVTYPQDDLEYQHSQRNEDEDDDVIEVKPELLSTQELSMQMEQDNEEEPYQEVHLQHKSTIEKRSTEDEEMEGALESTVDRTDTPIPPQPLSPELASSRLMEHHSDGTPAVASPQNGNPLAANEEEEEEEEEEESVSAVSPAMSSAKANNEAEDDFERVTADSPVMSMELLDMDAFLGDPFENLSSQKQKAREAKLQQEKEYKEKKKQEELRYQQEASRNKEIQEQVLIERERYELELQQRIQAQASRSADDDIVMESIENNEDESPQELDTHFQETEPANTNTGAGVSGIDPMNDTSIVKITEPDPNRGRYSRIIYKDLEVNPPPPMPATGMVNYKKFKKVKQFENYSSFELSQVSDPPPVPSSQNNRRRGREMFLDTDPGMAVPEDPDIAIRVNRRRYR